MVLGDIVIRKITGHFCIDGLGRQRIQMSQEVLADSVRKLLAEHDAERESSPEPKPAEGVIFNLSE